MKSALVGIDHSLEFGECFESFCKQIRSFQEKGFFPRVSVISVMHASQYLLPFQFYAESKSDLTKEAIAKLKIACEGRFQFDSVKILHATSADHEQHVSLLSRYAKASGTDLIIVGSHDRKGLPAWFLGSFSATASLRATVPVLVFKPGRQSLDLSKFRVIVAVDAEAAPDAHAVRFIAKAAKVADTPLDLVYIEKRGAEDSRSAIEKIQTKLKGAGVRSNAHVLSETRSVAHAIAEFAESRNASLTVCIAVKRSRVRKLLLGSIARQVLTLSHGPFLSVRWE